MSLSHKIDFALIFSVKNANPNGDPLEQNRPRQLPNGRGEVSDVCLKRKIRDRLQESGFPIFVQTDDRNTDGKKSLRERAEDEKVGLGKKAFSGDKNEIIKKACEKWFDVRAFGQIFPYKGTKKGHSNPPEDGNTSDNEKGEKGVSIAVRGPVTIQSAFSLEPIDVISTQITKSVSGEGDKKASDTMGMKHRVENAVYVTYGAITAQLAEKTGFSDKDADAVKSVLLKLFEGDASSARPEGSMRVLKVFWWKHNSKSGQYSSAKVHGSLTPKPDGGYELKELPGLAPEIIDGY
jgi:CRISPR-associated protein Csd2